VGSKENSVETLLNLCNEYSELSGMNVNDWVNVIQFECATKYKEELLDIRNIRYGIAILRGTAL
jgi:hypothetical protein